MNKARLAIEIELESPDGVATAIRLANEFSEWGNIYRQIGYTLGPEVKVSARIMSAHRILSSAEVAQRRIETGGGE